MKDKTRRGMEMIGTLEFYLTLLIIVIFYRDVTATDTVCTINPCLSGGTCAVGEPVTTAICTCATGFTGKKCETEVCPKDYCKNNGTCAPETGEPTKPDCTCATGFEGDTCEELKTVDGMWAGFGEWGECKETELKQTRTRNCTNPAPAGAPKMGKACDGDESEKKDCTICEVMPFPCNNGTCAGTEAAECTCEGGFTGDKCETAPTVCVPTNPCQNNGTCEVVEDNKEKYKCTCKTGFTGETCETSGKKDTDVTPTNGTDEGNTKAPADGMNPQNGTGTTGGAPIPMIQGIATKVLLFNLAACLQNWVKNNLQF